MRTLIQNLATSLMVASVLSIPAVSYADDTEIYFAKANAENSENKPVANVMIMLDTSGSMRFCEEEKSSAIWCSSVAERRINLLEDAINGILENTPDSVNLGLGRFSSDSEGGEVLVPVVPVNSKTKSSFASALNKINPEGRKKSPSNSVSPVGGTPTARAYAEMARYMLGIEAGFSYKDNGPKITVCDDEGDASCAGFTKEVKTVEACSGKGCKSRYVSPINTSNQCESNHIILFTDGIPSANESVSLDGVSCSAGGWFGGGTDNYTCQASIASHLNSEGNSKKVKINTHNIGLYMGAATEVKMKGVSEAGGGATHDSNSAETLLNAFLDTLDLIDEQSRSITAPGVAVNTMNRFQHLDELYYAVFKPVESSFWEGNLKRYQLKDQEIHGKNGAAIDSETGYFKADSQDFWSSTVDGADVAKGGARENVGTRNLFYTDESGGTQTLSWTSADKTNNTPKNTFFEGLGSTDEAGRIRMFDSLKTMWGDPMHSVPLMVNYGEDNNYVFVSTNGGMLHIIDTDDGGETAAFMPYELFKQAKKFTIEKPGLTQDNKRQLYGLDGSWIAWRKPGETLEDKPEKVYIYGGMRRGGKDYYALDVTTPSSPKMKWQISSGDEGFERLGQTWSTPTLTKVKTATGDVPALIFGGGYSPDDHDGPKHSRSAADKEGNAVYIVNAEDGSLIWSALSTAEMKWAIPGGISVVDIDFDGVADHLYFGDLGGQLFRADMSGTGQKPSVTRIADLGGTGADHRRFFEAPAVAYAKSGVKNLLYVVAGSGYRSHPLDEDTDEGIFVVIDDGALQESSSDMATLENMANVVTNAVETDDRGWYYLFEEESERLGEKALSSPVIFDNKIMFSTYAPTEDQEYDNPCAVRYGGAYLHTVNMRTGAPASLTGDAPDSRSQSLDQSTPPPTPTLLVDEEGNLVIVVGPEVVGEGDLGDPNLRKRRWMQLPKDEANKFRAIAEGTLEEEDADE